MFGFAAVLVCASTAGAFTGVRAQTSSHDKLQAYLARYQPSQILVSIDRPGQAPVELAYGLADADLGIPLRPDMRLGIGSLTKPLTAAALRLAEQGKMKLSDSICKFLTPCPSAWSAVSIENLLAHTSGIPDWFLELPAAPVGETRRIIDDAVAKHPMRLLHSHQDLATNCVGRFAFVLPTNHPNARPEQLLLRCVGQHRSAFQQSQPRAAKPFLFLRRQWNREKREKEGKRLSDTDPS